MVVKTRQQSKRDFEEISQEEDDSVEMEITKKKYKPNDEAKILNHNFKDSIIKEIIKNTTRKLLKTYKINEEYENEFNEKVDKNKVVENTKKKLVKDYKDNLESETVSIEDSSSSYDFDQDEEYADFFQNIDAIHSGTFFERNPIEEREKEFKKKFTRDEVMEMNDIFKNIKSSYKKNSPSIVDILKLDVSDEQKSRLLEKVHHFVNSEIISDDYNKNLSYILKNVKVNDTPELIKLEEEIQKASIKSGLLDDYKQRILKSNMSFNNKVVAYTKLETLQNLSDSNSEEYMSQKMWLDNLLSVPFGIYSGKTDDLPSEVLKRVDLVLNEKMSFLENPKDQILNIVAQMYRNKNMPINSIGIYGPKGVGKTNLIMSISEALNRPYRIIPLGGESDSSILTGNLKTYIGSMPGRIVEILRDTKCMNPIILFDELDKVSDDVKGKEIISALIHITDSTINNKYSGDRYFNGIDFDLSQVLFVFTYNDALKIDKILADRLYKIKVDNYTYKQKLEITKTHLLKSILKYFNFENIININDDAIEYIVRSCQEDPGMRTIKRKLQIIISRINILLLTEKNDNIVKLPYKELYNYYNGQNEKYIVLKEHVDIFLKESEVSVKPDIPFGLYI